MANDKMIRIRCSGEQLAKLKARAASNGMNLSAWLLHCGFGYDKSVATKAEKPVATYRRFAAPGALLKNNNP